MEVMVEVGAGLDVHKKTVMACCLDGRSNPPTVSKRRFGTFRHQLEQMRDWLKGKGCTAVAMESTGVYWIPVYRVLEGHLDIVLGNARHMANVPGRKTDQSDAEWIAQLLRFGLIRRNFVAPRPIFELRQLTRNHRKLVQMRTAAELRVEKLLQSSNIKLSSVASEVFGVSGRAMLDALARGKWNPQALAELSRGRLRRKIPELMEALAGNFGRQEANLLRVQLSLIDQIEGNRKRLVGLIAEKTGPYEAVITRLDTVPGINRTLAIEIVAETGAEMSRWPTAGHFASWCGVCPGNRESAGKRRRTHTREGRPPIRTILTQAALSASHVLGSHLASRYKRIAKRRGRQHAVMVIAHEIAISIYWMILREQEYQAPVMADRNNRLERRKARLLRDLHRLGVSIQVLPS